MTRIKFRVFDVKTATMYPVIDIAFDDRGNVEGVGFLDANGTGHYWEVADRELKLMQFTRLKNKNGKDLNWWVGDIIRGQPLIPLEIIEHEFGVGIRYFADGAWRSEQMTEELHDQLMEENAVVIGNVWEQPELLEAKQ
jgi:uncharacterized phage protein (TIGR01671 family)